MSDADVPREGDAFRRAFEINGAGTGAALDVFDRHEPCLRASVAAVEANARPFVRGVETGGVHLVVERLRQHVVRFGIGVEQVIDLAVRRLLAGEHGAADAEMAARAEARRGFLFDPPDVHPAADFPVAERAVGNRLR